MLGTHTSKTFKLSLFMLGNADEPGKENRPAVWQALKVPVCRQHKPGVWQLLLLYACSTARLTGCICWGFTMHMFRTDRRLARQQIQRCHIRASTCLPAGRAQA